MPLQREWVQLNLIFLFFFLVTSLAQNNCRSSCGDLRNVSSPFRFRDDPFECGSFAYELNCQDNKTVLVIDSWGLYVQAISYENSTMHLTYPSFTTIGSCHLPIHSSLGSADGYSSFRCYYFREWMTFVSCSRPIGNPTYMPIPCSNQETEEQLYLISDASYAYELEISCRLVTQPPFSHGYHHKGASWAKIQPNFQMGFDYSWFTCYSSLSIRSWCLLRTSTNMGFLRCLVDFGDEDFADTDPAFDEAGINVFEDEIFP